MNAQPRLLIVGGGHASLPLLAHARETGADVTLVSDQPELWYSGMTPEWLGGVYNRADVTVPLEPICRRQGVRFVRGRAADLDRRRREVILEGGDAVGYDVVAFDIGAVNPGREQAGDAVRVKPLWRIGRLDQVLQEAEHAPRHLVIVGGGAAGTECALNVTARLGELSVTIVEPGDRLCPSLPNRLSRGVAETLRERGATVRFGTRAAQVSDDGVTLESGETLPADAVLWATGSVGQPLFGTSGLSVTDRGFVRVERGLRAVGDGRVFVAGDAAVVDGFEDLPRIGVHAVKQGPVLRENVGRTLATVADGGDSSSVALRAFRPYPAAPLLLSTGEREAWLAVGPIATRSTALLRLKHAVDRRWIDRYRDGASYDGRWDARAAVEG